MTQQEIQEQAEKLYPSVDQSQLGKMVTFAERKAFVKGAQWMQEREKLDNSKLKHANLIIHRLTKIIENKVIPTQNEQGIITAAKKFITDNFDVADVLRTSPPKD